MRSFSAAFRISSPGVESRLESPAQSESDSKGWSSTWRTAAAVLAPKPGSSAIWAAEAGLPYCIADFINSDAVSLAQIYRSRFKPGRIAAPQLTVATWTIAAPTREEAERLSLPAVMMFAHLIRGELIAVPSVATAEAWVAQHGDPGRRRRTTLGTPAEVRAQLDDVAALYGADELMLVNILPDHAARVRSYALIAAEYGLAGLAQAA